ncbi:TPA: lngG [Salmonella enterica subsp. diarizonae serovar 60-67:z35:-]
MQKINIISVLFLTSFYLQASPEMSVKSGSVPVQPVADESAITQVTAGQNQIVSALQDDIVFEREKRQLSNELALEKLRAELQKVRGEHVPVAVMPVTPPVVMTSTSGGSSSPEVHVAAPTVVLVSQVAGISRIGVSVNGQLQFISRHETFTANGKKYQLVSTKNNKLVVREVK